MLKIRLRPLLVLGLLLSLGLPGEGQLLSARRQAALNLLDAQAAGFGLPLNHPEVAGLRQALRRLRDEEVPPADEMAPPGRAAMALVLGARGELSLLLCLEASTAPAYLGSWGCARPLLGPLSETEMLSVGRVPSLKGARRVSYTRQLWPPR